MKTVDFSESTAPYDLKVGRCRQLIEFMKYVSIEVKGQGHILTLAQGHLCIKKIKTCFSQKPLGRFNQNFYVSLKVHGNKNPLI